MREKENFGSDVEQFFFTVHFTVDSFFCGFLSFLLNLYRGKFAFLECRELSELMLIF